MPDTFLVGFLSALVIILVIALVAGIVGVVILFKKVNCLKLDDDGLHRRIDNEVNSINQHIDGNWNEMEKMYKSYIDKQINLLENRLKENK